MNMFRIYLNLREGKYENILMKKVPQKSKKEMKHKLFAAWGNEAYIKPVPKMSINLIKTKKAT